MSHAARQSVFAGVGTANRSVFAHPFGKTGGHSPITNLLPKKRPARSLALTERTGALVPGLVTESRADGLEPQVVAQAGVTPGQTRNTPRRAPQVWRRRSDTDSEAKTLAQVKLRFESSSCGIDDHKGDSE